MCTAHYKKPIGHFLTFNSFSIIFGTIWSTVYSFMGKNRFTDKYRVIGIWRVEYTPQSLKRGVLKPKIDIRLGSNTYGSNFDRLPGLCSYQNRSKIIELWQRLKNHVALDRESEMFSVFSGSFYWVVGTFACFSPWYSVHGNGLTYTVYTLIKQLLVLL